MSAPLQSHHHAMDDVSHAIDRLTLGAGREEPAGASPSEPTFRKILVALDASDTSIAARLWAVALAREFGAPVVATHVIPPAYTQLYDIPYGQVWPLASEYERVKEAGKRILEEGVAALRQAGLDVEGVSPVGSAPREIARVAERAGADLVVLGSHSRGPVGRTFLGSVSDGVRNRTKASVLVARSAPPVDQLVVGVDGSRASKDAARMALRLARSTGGRTTIVHAVEPIEPDFLVDEETLAAMTTPPSDARVDYVRRSGPAARVLAQVAREVGAGLVVVGARGLGAFGNLVMGSTSSGVCHQASTSVLVYREPAA